MTGVDASPRMVRRAQENALARKSRCLRGRALLQASEGLPSPFDAVLCLGNSLPHVDSDGELEASLRGMIDVLRPGGLLLLHNLNYDRRWTERPRFLKLDSGVVDGREVLIWRLADYEAARIIFHTALFLRDDGGRWQVQVNSTPQKPLFNAPLQDLLRRLGLSDVVAYGNLRGEPFVAEESADLVLAGTKPA